MESRTSSTSGSGGSFAVEGEGAREGGNHGRVAADPYRRGTRVPGATPRRDAESDSCRRTQDTHAHLPRARAQAGGAAREPAEQTRETARLAGRDGIASSHY